MSSTDAAAELIPVAAVVAAERIDVKAPRLIFPFLGFSESSENDEATCTSGFSAVEVTSSTVAAIVETADSCGPAQGRISVAFQIGSDVSSRACLVSADIDAIACEAAVVSVR